MHLSLSAHEQITQSYIQFGEPISQKWRGLEPGFKLQTTQGIHGVKAWLSMFLSAMADQSHQLWLQ